MGPTEPSEIERWNAAKGARLYSPRTMTGPDRHERRQSGIPSTRACLGPRSRTHRHRCPRSGDRVLRIAADECVESLPDHRGRPRGDRACRRRPDLARDADRLRGRRGHERGVPPPLLRRPRGRPHRIRRCADLPPDGHLGIGARPRVGLFDPERPAGLAQDDADVTAEDGPGIDDARRPRRWLHRRRGVHRDPRGGRGIAIAGEFRDRCRRDDRRGSVLALSERSVLRPREPHGEGREDRHLGEQGHRHAHRHERREQPLRLRIHAHRRDLPILFHDCGDVSLLLHGSPVHERHNRGDTLAEWAKDPEEEIPTSRRRSARVMDPHADADTVGWICSRSSFGSDIRRCWTILPPAIRSTWTAVSVTRFPVAGIPWNAPVWVPWNRPTVTTWSPSATMLSFTYRPSGNAAYRSARPRRNPARSNRGTPGARPTNSGARRSPWTFRSCSP